MNGVFNSGLGFWQLIGGVVLLTISAIAIKITFSFDINKFLERKDKRNNQKLKNACTHLEMIPAEDGQFQIRSLFESPSGTLQWQCQRCGLIRNHDNDYEQRAEYYAKNPDIYLKQNKKFSQILKKNGMR